MPPTATPLLLRTVLPGTRQLQGTWDPDNNQFQLARDGWTIYWFMVAEWSLAPVSPSAQPKSPVTPPPGKWQDVYDNPPPQNSVCWIRRWSPCFPLLKVVWNPNSDGNFVLDDTFWIPWFCVIAWKPAA